MDRTIKDWIFGNKSKGYPNAAVILWRIIWLPLIYLGVAYLYILFCITYGKRHADRFLGGI